MNIVKFKDTIIDGDDVFNGNFKGKYVYWLGMHFAIPFDSITTDDYITYERSTDLKNDLTVAKVLFIDTDDYSQYIDVTDTEKTNDISTYVQRNMFTPDEEITIEELKKFRTWLASTLVSFDTDENGDDLGNIYSDDESHVLRYYANGMFDDIVKYLNVFGKTQISVTNNVIGLSACGCQNNFNTSMNVPAISSCDSVSIYKTNIYKKMVDMFSNIMFWQQFSTKFISEFKLYIENILKCGFSLAKSQYVSDLVDCGCVVNSTQAEMTKILQQLVNALQYIIDDEVAGHKNYIGDAFANWSKYLYESMEW